MNERTTAPRLAARGRREARVVDRLVEAELSREAGGGEPLQVRARRLGRHHQRERRGVGRDHQVLGQPALEPEAGHAEGAVLVVEGGVDRVVARLGHAPGHAALAAVGDLPVHRRAAGALEQRVLVRRHHQERHQVLEHRAAPRQQRRLAAGAVSRRPRANQLSCGSCPARSRRSWRRAPPRRAGRSSSRRAAARSRCSRWRAAGAPCRRGSRTPCAQARRIRAPGARAWRCAPARAGPIRRSGGPARATSGLRRALIRRTKAHQAARRARPGTAARAALRRLLGRRALEPTREKRRAHRGRRRFAQII